MDHNINTSCFNAFSPRDTPDHEETDTQLNNEKSVIRVFRPICDDCSVRTAVIKLNVDI